MVVYNKYRLQGNYSSRVGGLLVMENNLEATNSPKPELLFWLTLSNKVSTWDILQKLTWSRIGFYILCMSNQETL